MPDTDSTTTVRQRWLWACGCCKAHAIDIYECPCCKDRQPLEPLGDALALAVGSHDYNGGHKGDLAEAFHAGIETVVNVLRSAIDRGLKDTQTDTVYRIGQAAVKVREAGKPQAEAP